MSSDAEHPRGPAPSILQGPGPAHEPADDAQYLLRILSGKYHVQALSTLAALGVPDLLRARPRTGAELARELGYERDPLERLLRFTVGMGFLELGDGGRFLLTRRGATLCGDALGPLATFVGSPEQWDPWARLRDTLAPGSASPFETTFGAGLYEYLAGHPEAAARYDRAIDAFTQEEARALGDAFDFAAVHTLVDVGGGRGTLLFELLERWPHLRGVLVDRPHVVERARPRVPAALAPRLELEGGDFFRGLPRGHDVYCLKHVLHNWDDERATALLGACREALAPDGHVLVIEAILTPDNRPDLARVLDLEMSVLTRGRARRKPEFRRLFKSAGLALEDVRPVGSSWLLVGTASE